MITESSFLLISVSTFNIITIQKIICIFSKVKVKDLRKFKEMVAYLIFLMELNIPLENLEISIHTLCTVIQTV